MSQKLMLDRASFMSEVGMVDIVDEPHVDPTLEEIMVLMDQNPEKVEHIVMTDVPMQSVLMSEEGQVLDAEGYGALARVLKMAFDQASSGKGSERHGNSMPFDQQPMQSISQLLGSCDGLAFQVMKKTVESKGLPTLHQKVRELLGVINYAAGMVIFLEEQERRRG